LEKSAVVEDSVLGADVVAAAGAAVITSIVDDGCRIGRRAVVGASTTIEPGARLEPGSRA